MRRELAALGIESAAPDQSFEFGLQFDQRPARRHRGDDGARFLAAETRQAAQRHLERLAIDPKQHRRDLVGGGAVDITDEAEREVVFSGSIQRAPGRPPRKLDSVRPISGGISNR